MSLSKDFRFFGGDSTYYLSVYDDIFSLDNCQSFSTAME